MNLASNINFFLGLQNQIKINHWQTKSYARHKAFGDYYEAMDGLIDQFVEAAIGKYGRFQLSDETKTLELNNLSDLDVKGLLETVKKALIQIGEQLAPEDTDLVNLRDEMLQETNKLLYLLTLK